MRPLAALSAFFLTLAVCLGICAYAWSSQDTGAWADPSASPSSVITAPATSMTPGMWLSAVLGSIFAVAAFLNRWLPPGTAGWRVLIDRLAPLAMQEHSGVAGPLNLPGMRSRKRPPRGPIGPAVIAILGMTLAACAHGKAIAIDIGKCALGQVPSAVSHIIPDVTAILGGESPNWQQDLTNLGISAGLNTVTCGVASIIDELTAKRGSLDSVGRRKLERGQLWLSQHGGAQ